MKLRNVLFSLFLITILVITITPASVSSKADTHSAELHSDDSIALDDSVTQPSIVGLDEESPPLPASDSIVIIVENALYSSVASAVAQYRMDLNNTGYHTILYTEVLTSAEQIKANLSAWYDSESIIGAVLIGHLPYAQFYHPANGGFSAETFICDLFLMDLDGTWADVNPVDGFYDTHSAIGNADISAEIFVARIDPTCLSWGTSVADHINTYLARIHAYRTGGVQRNNRALVYIDDDWIPWASQWSTDISYSYPARTNVFTSAYTNATDWLTNRLLQDYQWAHLCAHSSPTTHYFGPGGSGQGTATSTQIRGVPPSFNFYNLFCCSGAKWTVGDNLGVTYVFSGPYSLAAIGSSKTGSMMDNDAFYSPLGQNATLGESLVDWFRDALRPESEAGSLYLEWYYGMNIIGDPFLGIHYDSTVLAPTVTSDTHPIRQSWYENSLPIFNWTTPPDVNAITGYYYVLDQNPSTIPDASTGTFTLDNSLAVNESLSSGQWYFHLVATDSAGNVGQNAAHYRVQIDTAGPITNILNPIPLQNITITSFDFAWSAFDIHSGFAYSQLRIDDVEAYNGTAFTYLADSLAEGLHTVNLTTCDNLGNTVTVVRSFRVDLSAPIITLFATTGDLTLGSIIGAEWVVSDSGSGYCCADIYLDGEFLVHTNVSQTSYLLGELDAGNHTLNITVFDWAGLNSSQMISFVIANPAPDWLLPLGIAVPVILLVIVLGIYVKRR